MSCREPGTPLHRTKVQGLRILELGRGGGVKSSGFRIRVLLGASDSTCQVRSVGVSEVMRGLQLHDYNHLPFWFNQ